MMNDYDTIMYKMHNVRYAQETNQQPAESLFYHMQQNGKIKNIIWTI